MNQREKCHTCGKTYKHYDVFEVTHHTETIDQKGGA